MRNVYIKGQIRPNIPLKNEINTALHNVGIDNSTRMSLADCIYWVGDTLLHRSSIESDLGRQIMSERMEVSWEEFLQIVRAEDNRDWFLNLQIGDQVMIVDRQGEPEDYPFSYAEEMDKYAGQVFEIEQIIYDDVDEYEQQREYYNGDNNAYRLKGTDCYTWHSSMFEPVNQQKIQKLELSDINIPML